MHYFLWKIPFSIYVNNQIPFVFQTTKKLDLSSIFTKNLTCWSYLFLADISRQNSLPCQEEHVLVHFFHNRTDKDLGLWSKSSIFWGHIKFCLVEKFSNKCHVIISR